jgi:diaminohydroxyphosphoribosylaminopyrimidine deaminase/5-amino-6-(5-phosphoribosylamino)uracil reductase
MSVVVSDTQCLRLALQLARRGRGATSPNPMVGAVLVRGGEILGRGWHRRAGAPHAEIEALRDAESRGHSPRGATLVVTLEPCCTHGRTPPCTAAIIAAGVKRVVAGATDPNPRHVGKGFGILRRAGLAVTQIGGSAPGLARDCEHLNEAFNHWIVHRTPFVLVKAAMTLDGKIATATGESKWITGEKARAFGMELRRDSDAILVGIHTILADDPSLTVRTKTGAGARRPAGPVRRIVLDSLARTPLKAKIVNDEFAAATTVVVSRRAPKSRVAALGKKVNVWLAPSAARVGKLPGRGASRPSGVDLRWVLKRLGAENVTRLLVEGGGEVNAAFLLGGLAQRVAFFYAPKILGGSAARKAVAGEGAGSLRDVVGLREVQWRKVGDDLLLTALVGGEDHTPRPGGATKGFKF